VSTRLERAGYCLQREAGSRRGGWLVRATVIPVVLYEYRYGPIIPYQYHRKRLVRPSRASEQDGNHKESPHQNIRTERADFCRPLFFFCSTYDIHLIHVEVIFIGCTLYKYVWNHFASGEPVVFIFVITFFLFPFFSSFSHVCLRAFVVLGCGHGGE